MFGMPRPLGSLRPLGAIPHGPTVPVFGEARVVDPRACRAVILAGSRAIAPRACRVVALAPRL